jgi:hypothetical protein
MRLTVVATLDCARDLRWIALAPLARGSRSQPGYRVVAREARVPN